MGSDNRKDQKFVVTCVTKKFVLSRPHTAQFCLRFPMIIYYSPRYPRQSSSMRVSMMRHAAITPDFRRSYPIVACRKVLNMFKNY